MSDPSRIAESSVPGEEIGPVIDLIESAIVGVPKIHVLIALASMMLLLQNPRLNASQIFDGVQEVSRFICVWLDGTYPQDEPSKIN